MRLKSFKLGLLLAAVVVGLPAKEAQAAGIPTYCYSCDYHTAATGYGIMDAIRMQSDAMLNGMDYATKAATKVNVQTATSVLKTERMLEAAQQHDPALAKPEVACAAFNGAGVRAAAGQSSKELSEALAQRAKAYNMKASQLSPAESRADYFDNEIISKLSGEDNRSVVDVVRRDSFSDDEVSEVIDDILFATNPKPLPVPSEEELGRIKEHGNPRETDAYSRVLVHNDRVQRMQQILLEQKASDLERFEAKDFEYLIDKIKPALTAEQKEQLEGKLSKNKLDEFMATYRVGSKDWVKRTHSGGERRVLNDMALMKAEQLRLLWSLNEKLDTLITIGALAESNRLAQAGASER